MSNDQKAAAESSLSRLQYLHSRSGGGWLSKPIVLTGFDAAIARSLFVLGVVSAAMQALNWVLGLIAPAA